VVGRRGRDVLLDILDDEGVHHIFGNPGTTELPLMDELAARPEFEYVLCLQENTAVGMADGYAQATGRPALVNLHTSSGLGGGMGNVTNAVANRTPLVVTAGQQDRRHLVAEPMLSADLVGMIRAVTKWQHEVRGLAELGTVMRRSFIEAASPPPGPVFVSIPMDVLDETGEVDVPGRSTIVRGPVASGLEDCARLLAEAAPDELAVVAGEEVASSRALGEITRLAELLGCPVYGTPLYGALVFPVDHPLWSGMLPPTAAATREALSPYRRVFYVGCQVGFVYPYSPGPALPPGVELLHLSNDARLVGRTYRTRLGLIGDVQASLAALLPLVEGLADGRRAASARAARAEEMLLDTARVVQTALGRYDSLPMHPMAAAHALIEALPAGGVVVDEAITAGVYVRGFHRTSVPGTYFFCRGGGLGWGMPAALGIQLARPGAPVLCVVGDGSAMYAIQSLYTAARYGLDVVIAVVDNRQYRILRDNLAGSGGHSARSGRFVGMDLDEPPIDYVSIAAGLGVRGVRVEKAADVTDAARAAFDSGVPWLLELPVRGG
jgi:benzoylformate decarboxylase